jgi:uncharacterized protein (TIGR03067 family)
MRLHGLAALAAGLLWAPDLAAVADRPGKSRPPTAREELKRFLGEWRVIRLQEGKEVLPSKAGETVAIRLTFRRHRLTIRKDPGVVSACTFTLRPAKKPKEIDLREKGEAKGRKYRGIYRFRRGALTLLLAFPGHRRPGAFKSPSGPEHILLVLVPHRPAQKKPAPPKPAPQPKAKPGAAGGGR